MKSGTLLFALIIMALVALPLAPFGDSSLSGVTDQTPVNGGMGHGYRYGAGQGTPANDDTGKGPRQMPQGAGHGQARAAQPETKVLERDPFDWNSMIRSLKLRSYRRLFPKNILENEKRQQIYSTILMNPGIDIQTLASYTDINLHTLRYHVLYLVRMKKIACIEQGGGYHFFENHGRFDHAGQQVILFQRYPTTKQILAAVAAFPGITRGEIAASLGFAGPSVTRWMRRLAAESLVTEVRDGRYVHYYPAIAPMNLSGS